MCLFLLASFTAHRESMILRERERERAGKKKQEWGPQKICHNSQWGGLFFLFPPEEWAFMVVLVAATVRM
jgi:hypothetical protein